MAVGVKTRVWGPKVKELIKILSFGPLSTSEIAFLMGQSPIRTKDLIYYVRNWHGFIKTQWDGRKYLYSVDKDVADEVLKHGGK